MTFLLCVKISQDRNFPILAKIQLLNLTALCWADYWY